MSKEPLSIQFSVKLTERMHRQIKLVASAWDISMNEFVRRSIASRLRLRLPQVAARIARKQPTLSPDRQTLRDQRAWRDLKEMESR